MKTIENEETMHIGLCLAGSISAGAYTAGVIDFILEALERWELAKEMFPNDKSIPRHKVEIRIITGASGGAIAGGFLILQNHKKFEVFDVEKPTQIDPKWYEKSSIQYDAWVNLTEKDENASILNQLLYLEDLKVHKGASFFNSNFFEKLTNKIVHQTEYSKEHKLKYIADDLEFAASVSNLDGIGSTVTFNQGQENETGENAGKYLTKSSKDLAHFQLVETEFVVPKDGQIPLLFNKNKTINTKVFGEAMMATSAFPFGFKPRFLTRDGKYILKNPLLSNPESIALNVKEGQDYTTMNVDGGMMNNEPFEVAAYLLQRKFKSIEEDKYDINKVVEDFINQNCRPRTLNEFSTILMIDPFPTESDLKIETNNPKPNLIATTLKIITSLRNQPLVKNFHINNATNPRDYSRFMLAPRRKKINANGTVIDVKNGSKAIACGALDGFGGFLDKDIRLHDYELGRFNCQHFLQKRFGVDTQLDNDLYNQLFPLCQEETSEYINKETHIFPFIPDIMLVDGKAKINSINDYSGNLNKNPLAPHFPNYIKFTVNEIAQKMESVSPLLRARIKILMLQLVPNFLFRLFLRVFSNFLSKRIESNINEIVLRDLDNHGMIKK
jgi:predicted acylesterase/phospholipase RssA